MILDRLEYASAYRGLGRRVVAALEYLAATDFRQVPLGRHELDGTALVAIVQRYTTKPAAEARWEGHRRYLDVQYVVEGGERFGYAPLRPEWTVVEPYDADRDIAFVRAQGSFFELSEGSFAILAPHDLHAPGLHLVESTPGEVLKVVMKVAVG
jgi:YhcH/YjgK/YiaL family protein